MLFTTIPFVLFFLAVYPVYLAFPGRPFRHALLLVSSSFFYAWWNPRYLALMWGVILVAYGAGLALERRPGQRKFTVAGSVTLLLSLIAIFKYAEFFRHSLVAVGALFGGEIKLSPIQILLPVGISFYAFHGISYVVDVYRGVIPAQRNPTIVALYISYFPQLVAGPIVRAGDFIPQLNSEITVNADDVREGLRNFIIGMIYKLTFADQLALWVDPVLSNIKVYDNASVTAAVLGFYGQIYFDFAGYSLMAIGLARAMGYRFPANFDYPYLATSITDFWRRWHISLSTWLRNYLYIPLGGNRCARWKQYRNLILTMLLGGLWHGASWNFVLWGGLQGVALAAHRLFRGKNADTSNLAPNFFTSLPSWVLTQAFVALAWVPFRLPEFPETLQVYSAIARLRDDQNLKHAGISYWTLCLPLIIDGLLGIGRNRPVWSPWLRLRNHLPYFVEPFLIGLLFALAMTTLSMSVKSFIYFQF